MKMFACALVLSGSAATVAVSAPDANAQQSRATSGLQLAVVSPDPTTIGDKLSLDVSFRGGVVDTVELYLDGNLVSKRQLNTTQIRGMISFSLDTLLLTAADHDVQVRATGANGKTVVATGKIRVVAADLSAPVRIAYPQNGIQVSGAIPVRVQIDNEIQKQKPYVSFFVDKELKVLRNYPPYEYVWDTTKTNNGWHIVEAMTQIGDSLTPLKARPVHVNVNNAAGDTRKLDKIEDLSIGSKVNKPIVMTPNANSATTGAQRALPGISNPIPMSVNSGIKPANPGDLRGAEPSGTSIGVRSLPNAANTSIIARNAALPGTERRPMPDAGNTRSAEPSAYGYGTRTMPNAAAPSISVNTSNSSTVSPRMGGGAVVQPKTSMAIPSAPQKGLPAMPQADRIFSVVQPIQSEGTGFMTVQPGDTVRSISRRTGVRENEIVRLNNLRGTASLVPGRKLIVPGTGSFDVAFNGTPIRFDVAPRVEAGIRLAPFRQIFEYTGGKLYWFNEAKTVRAVNDSREIEIKIGNSNATVNNQTVTMERKPFIESGRTIVPLTFIRDAMDVRINFNPKTGRLLIENNK